MFPKRYCSGDLLILGVRRSLGLRPAFYTREVCLRVEGSLLVKSPFSREMNPKVLGCWFPFVNVLHSLPQSLRSLSLIGVGGDSSVWVVPAVAGTPPPSRGGERRGLPARDPWLARSRLVTPLRSPPQPDPEAGLPPLQLNLTAQNNTAPTVQ